MLPLAGKTLPQSAAELETAIGGALEDLFLLRRDRSAVSVTGPRFPSIRTIRIDLNNAEVNLAHPPPRPPQRGRRDPGPRVDRFDLTAKPLRYENARLDLRLSATGLQFDFNRDKRGRSWLMLSDAKAGKVDARIAKSDLQRLLTEIATMVAREQGVTVQKLDLALKQAGPRSVACDARVKASKIFVSGVIRITGQLDLDDQLNATLSNLSCSGEGIIGSAAASVAKMKLAEFEGK